MEVYGVFEAYPNNEGETEFCFHCIVDQIEKGQKYIRDIYQENSKRNWDLVEYHPCHKSMNKQNLFTLIGDREDCSKIIEDSYSSDGTLISGGYIIEKLDFHLE